MPNLKVVDNGNLPFIAALVFQSLLSHVGFGIILPLFNATRTFSPFSVYLYDTSVGFLEKFTKILQKKQTVFLLSSNSH